MAPELSNLNLTCYTGSQNFSIGLNAIPIEFTCFVSPFLISCLPLPSVLIFCLLPWIFLELLLFSRYVLTLCFPMDCSTPAFPVLRYLMELAQTHVYWVSDAVQPSHPLLPSSPPALNLSIKVFSNESTLHIRWPKHWNFSFSFSNEYSGLISFTLTGLIFLLSKGPSRVFTNTTVQKHQFFSTQRSLCSTS